VSTPLLIDELTGRGLNHADAIVRMGQVSSLWGTGLRTRQAVSWEAWAISGAGGVSFLIGLAGAVAFTLFVHGRRSGAGIFMLAWIGNRLTQSIAWGGLIKVSSKWFDYTSYGSVIGGTEHQLPGRRMRAARQVDGHADATWLRLAGALLFRGGRGRCDAALQWAVSCANRAKDLKFDEAKPNPLNLVRRRGVAHEAYAACCCRCCAAAHSC